MFEKEAEEYGKENCVIQKNGLCTFVDTERTSKIWKDGAEFGYNKANEWHKVLDGVFPKHNNEVLCLLWGRTKEIGYYENEMWYFENFTADKDDVDYWKEIILP